MAISTQQCLHRHDPSFRDLRRRAQEDRAAYVRALASHAMPPMPELSPAVKRKVMMFGAALGLATASFWAVILTSPPQTAAALGATVPVFEMMRNAPLTLPGLDADAI
jgi:hypothetical protein